VRVWFVSVCRKTTLTPGINPPEVSLIVPSNVPLVFEFCAADAATPARTSSNTNKALPSERLADSGRLHLRKGLKSHTSVELDSLDDDYAEPKAPVNRDILP
jgi:hypothetical protein